MNYMKTLQTTYWKKPVLPTGYTAEPHIFPHQRYVGWSCVLNCFMLSSLPYFYAFCWSVIPTSCYIFNVFYSCSCHFFSSRCVLELKLVIYYRAACPPSQASYAVLAGESQAFFKHPPLTNSIANSAIYSSLLKVQSSKWFVRMRTREKNGVVKEAIVLQRVVRIASCDFKSGKKRWAGALLSEKCCCFVQKPSWKIHANLN